MDLQTAAQKVAQTPERLAEWEAGTRVPTLNQLRNLADVYKRSVGVFFLRERPKVPKRPVDYRRLELSSSKSMSHQLAHGIREAEAKREAALEIYGELEQAPPAWDLFLDKKAPAIDAAAILSGRLGVSRTRWRTPHEALAGWRNAIESLGVLVVQLSRVSMGEMRGCSLALYPLPVIILNGADSPLGRVFTLLHELTHLARAESSLCDLTDERHAEVDSAVETYCNAVAGNVLIPAGELLARPDVARAGPETEWGSAELSEMSRRFWASRESVLRRLMDLGKTSRAYYRVMREKFQQEYQREREKTEGFVPPHLMVMLSNGRFLTRLALRAYSAEAITGTELSRVLSTKLDHVPKIRDALRETAT
jgi:Zn-dependent peptidase ImmA (M78 family)